MPSDIVRKLSHDERAPAATAKPRAIEHLWEADAAAPAPTKSSPVRKLTSGAVVDTTPKQTGKTRVAIVTPYACDDAQPIIAALNELRKPKGLNFPDVAAIFHEGSDQVGRLLPRLAPKYNFTHLVRDHHDFLKAHAHLGGSGLHPDPAQEVRLNLDDVDRLLRRDAKDSIDDLLDLRIDILIAVPGSARITYATGRAAEMPIPVLVAAADEPMLHINDIEPAAWPITVLIATPPNYADGGLLAAYVLHFMMSGSPLRAVFFTPSPAGQALAGAALGPGTPLRMKLNATHAEQLLDCKPDVILLASGNTLTNAVEALAQQKQIPVFSLAPP